MRLAAVAGTGVFGAQQFSVDMARSGITAGMVSLRIC